jgi:hypothetical protein
MSKNEDIVSQLRDDHVCEGYRCLWDDVMRDAADEIERLRAEVELWKDRIVDR